MKKITIKHLLQHTAGFDRAKSFDPMFRPVLIAKDQKTRPPAGPMEIIHYMTRHKLDFDPGERYAYSNFGYCLLGRVIEKASGQSYESAVHKHVFEPIGIKHTQLGRTLEGGEERDTLFRRKEPNGERDHGPQFRQAGAVAVWRVVSGSDGFARRLDFDGGRPGPFRVGLRSRGEVQDFEGRQHQDDVRFADGLAGHGKEGKAKAVYYGCGWQVRTIGGGKINTWHTGSLDGTATLLVRRSDGLTWAVLFNTRNNAKGQYLAGLIDPMVHEAADKVKRWPAKEVVVE